MSDYPWHRYGQNYEYMGVFVGATYAQTAYVQLSSRTATGMVELEGSNGRTYGIASLLAYVYLKRPKKDPWLIPFVVSPPKAYHLLQHVDASGLAL